MYCACKHFICRALLAEGCDSPYLLGFLVELLQWRLEGEQDGAQVSDLLILVQKNLPDQSDELFLKNIRPG